MSRTPFEIVPEGSITSTPGIQAAGVACGLKPTGALDLALVYSPTPCTAAAMYTTNAFQSAPV
ncbi:MAG: bifunctional ornithine acetyltransferase/N-acetylglutamate synthase, partial [Chloroflexi bacterium]|nr:bifunctional ornithine acetyltransferase/N-acetylglutamate synthase [Chloroflexota bacterium]